MLFQTGLDLHGGALVTKVLGWPARLGKTTRLPWVVTLPFMMEGMMHWAASGFAFLPRKQNCLISLETSASLVKDKCFTGHLGISGVTRGWEILLTVDTHVMFPWEKKSACCNKAFSFAVSIFQRFKTIGNTHHLLPKGLLASKRICFSLLLVFSGT